MGKKIMKTKKIEDISARQVTFSKRRQGLLKKARELSILCEAEVAALVFSPAGRFHHYASSNIDDILHKFSLHSADEQHPVNSQDDADLSSGIQEKIKCFRMIISMYLHHQWGMEELQQLETKLEAILKNVTSRKKELAMNELPVALDQTKNVNDWTSFGVKDIRNMGKGTQPAEMGPGDEETGCSIANIINLGGDSNYPPRWIPPPPDIYKANFAGAHFQEMNASGTGVVFRNRGGEFMAAQARFLPEQMDENEASLMAAKSAVEFAVDYSFTHVILEGDAHHVIDTLINSDEADSPYCTGILQEAKICTKQLESCAFSHVQQSANTAARMVAQYAINVKEEDVWLIKEPEFLGDILLSDAIHLNHEHSAISPGSI